FRIALLVPLGMRHRIPQPADRGLEVVGTGGARVVHDGGALGAVVGVGLGHAGEPGEPVLDPARARGARHTFHGHVYPLELSVRSAQLRLSHDPDTIPLYPIPTTVEEPMRRYSMHKDDYRTRLRRIEGQVRGLQRMIDEDEYCVDILTQIVSVTKALQGVGLGLLDEHLRSCVRDAAESSRAEGDAKLTEPVQAVERLLKV